MSADTPTDSFHERVQDARKQLLKIPGVVSVSVGYKQTGRDLTEVLSLRVYVEEKKKPENIPGKDLIPKVVNEIPTDVIEKYIPGKVSKGGTRPLVGGIVLTEYDDIQPKSTGTLGCMAKQKSDSKHIIISCQHVLHSTGSLASPENNPNHLARQPKRKECSEFHYENIVGPIIAGMEDNFTFKVKGTDNDLYVDTAYALINNEVHSKNEIDRIGTIQGTDDLTGFIDGTVPPQYQVRKMGEKTGLTSGTVVEISHQLDWPAEGGSPASTSYNCILIRPDNGYKEIKATYIVDPSKKQSIKDAFAANEPLVTITENGNVLTFTTKSFLDGGDSGSVVVNAQSKVIGVLFASSLRNIPVMVDGSPDYAYVNTGIGFACHIQPAMDALGFTIEQGPVEISGLEIDLEDIRLEEAEESMDVMSALSRAENEVRAIPSGAEMIDLFRQNVEELIQLIHHFRPVKVVWHRNHCPAFAVSFLNLIRDPGQPLQKEVNGVSVSHAAAAVRNALETHGSSSLRGTLQQYGNLVVDMLSRCRKYKDMLHYLEEHLKEEYL